MQRAPPAHCSPNGLTSVPALPLLPPWASQIAGLEDAALFAAEANAARNAFLARAPGAQHMVRSSSAHIPGALESTEKAPEGPQARVPQAKDTARDTSGAPKDSGARSVMQSVLLDPAQGTVGLRLGTTGGGRVAIDRVVAESQAAARGMVQGDIVEHVAGQAVPSGAGASPKDRIAGVRTMMERAIAAGTPFYIVVRRAVPQGKSAAMRSRTGTASTKKPHERKPDDPTWVRSASSISNEADSSTYNVLKGGAATAQGAEDKEQTAAI